MLLPRASTGLLSSAQALFRAQNWGQCSLLDRLYSAEGAPGLFQEEATNSSLATEATDPAAAAVAPRARESVESLVGSQVIEFSEPPVPPAPEYEGEPESLREFRLHNSSIWGLKGQVVSGRVVVVGKDYVIVDLGFKSYSRFFKKELSTTQIYAAGEGHKVKRKEGTFFKDDYLRFRVEDVESPYGDMHLTASRLEASIRKELIWKELKEAYLGNIAVQGRVLNPTDRGYAVGVGGFVAFCPLVSLPPHLGEKVGLLQPFRIIKMIDPPDTTMGRSITLVSPEAVSSTRQRRTAFFNFK